jgi:pSer/pThr/pTyr-binding forkhead associated (FHA) protein
MRIIKIGRSPENDWVIEDEMVSKFHLKIFQTESGQIFAQDLDSSNGTFLNGQKFKNEEKIIQMGDKIRIGQTDLDWESRLIPGQVVERADNQEIISNDLNQQNLIANNREKFDEANNRVLLYGFAAIALLLIGFLLTWYFNFVVKP